MQHLYSQKRASQSIIIYRNKRRRKKNMNDKEEKMKKTNDMKKSHPRRRIEIYIMVKAHESDEFLILFVTWSNVQPCLNAWTEVSFTCRKEVTDDETCRTSEQRRASWHCLRRRTFTIRVSDIRVSDACWLAPYNAQALLISLSLPLSQTKKKKNKNKKRSSGTQREFRMV